MRFYPVYRCLTALWPRPHYETKNAITRIYARYHVKGGVFCRFGRKDILEILCVGNAAGSVPAQEDTFFRLASVTKTVTAMMVMRLAEQGKIDPDEDISLYSGRTLRSPVYPDVKITLRMLLQHTSGLTDGGGYYANIAKRAPLEKTLREAAFASYAPGTGFSYSNFAFGLAGSILESATGGSLDTLLRECFPGTRASFFPGDLPRGALLADGMSPHGKKPLWLGSEALQRRPVCCAEPEMHYMQTHGSLCMTAGELAGIGRMLMNGFETMREPAIPFGRRDPHITQGTGLFIVKDDALCTRTVYGHQGMAYGMIHGLFYEPVSGQGFVSLTTGASPERRYVLADLNRALIRKVFSENDK